jgi:hypothetical protein
MNILDSPNDALDVNLKFSGTKNLIRKCGNLVSNVIAILVFKH